MTALAPFLEKVAESYEIAPDVAFQLNLALDEAMANSVSYAYEDGSIGPITLEVEKEENSIVLRLIDEGVAFDPTEGGAEVDTGLSAQDRPVGGLGIFLIKQMMDDMTYKRENGKNILTMKKQINK